LSTQSTSKTYVLKMKEKVRYTSKF